MSCIGEAFYSSLIFFFWGFDQTHFVDRLALCLRLRYFEIQSNWNHQPLSNALVGDERTNWNQFIRVTLKRSEIPPFPRSVPSVNFARIKKKKKYWIQRNGTGMRIFRICGCTNFWFTLEISRAFQLNIWRNVIQGVPWRHSFVLMARRRQRRFSSVVRREPTTLATPSRWKGGRAGGGGKGEGKRTKNNEK